jgi:chromosomal replication initiator protein
LSTTTLDVVAALGHALCQRIGEPRYDLWFKKTTTFRWEPGLLTVGVPNRFYQEWLQNTFAADVQTAAETVLGEKLTVRFVIEPALFQAARQRQAAPDGDVPHQQAVPSASGRPATTPSVTDQPATSLSLSGPRRHPTADALDLPQRPRRFRRLEDFVEGACNRVAYASARSVVEAPGHDANPLVLHGPVGVGKSHLLEGIAAGLREANPDWRILFLSAEEFTHRFVQAMRHHRIAAFRKQFRGCDALLLDDMHFLAKKNATQEEFLHTLDSLHRDGRPVAATCDCHPRLTDGLLPELVDRLQGGATWGLMSPDADTRVGILRRLNRRSSAEPLPESVVQLLAEQLRGNVRELEGAFHSVRHLAKATGRPLTMEVAREALAEVLRHSVRLVQLVDVDRAVCAALCLPAATLQSSKRGWTVSHPRMLAIYLARKHTAATHTEVGQYFGDRNHSTAVAAEKKIRTLVQEDGVLAVGPRKWRVRELVERVERELLSQ